jgi:glucokinase
VVKSGLPETKPVVAMDIGGTKIMTALFSEEGKILTKDIRPTLAEQGVDAVIERLCSAISDILNKNKMSPPHIHSISIACAGGVDTGKGVVVTPSPHLPDWANLPLANIIKKKLGVTAYVLNDASAAALGEQRYGVGKGVKNLVLFTLGTGIGGGVVIDGRLYLGARGGAGEFGHMTVDANGPNCDCGNTGCLELYASGTAIENYVKARIKDGAESSLVGMSDGEADKITVEMVAAVARNGDKLAQDVISRAAYYLGVGMVNVVNIFNPEMIIISGGMAALGDLIIAPGRKMVAARAFSINAKSVRIVTGNLGNEAGVYGAAAFAFDIRRV